MTTTLCGPEVETPPTCAPASGDIDQSLKDHDALINRCAFSDDANCSETELAARRQARLLEQKLCSKSFVLFLRWVKIAEPPALIGGTGGIIPFELWPHLLDIIETLQTERLINILKARQNGVSWLIAAYADWLALFKEAASVIFFSKGLLEAQELLAKSRFIHEHLPLFLQLKTGASSRTELAFPTMNSVIRALPATEAAGVSFTASLLVYDEWEQHEYAEQNYANAKPVIDAGGQVVGIFTRDPFKATSLARQLFIDAQAGRNRFKPMFFAWNVRPGRTAAWYEETKESIPTLELGTLTPELYMSSNYPLTAEEALAPLQASSACDQAVLEQMREDTRSTVTVVRDGLDTRICNIFKPHSLGAFYIAATDTSHGVGLDDSVTVLLNVKTGEIVADIMECNLPPDQLAFHSIRMLEYFMKPLWYIEDNEWGKATIDEAKKQNYPNLGKYHDSTGKVNLERVGWHTGPGNRDLLWGALIPAINNRQIVIYNARGLAQFRDLIRNSKKEGRIEAQKGRKDDYPVAVGIAYYNRGQVQTDAHAYRAVETLHFRHKNRRQMADIFGR